MRCKRRYMHGRRRKRSPLHKKKGFDFTKSKDYSSEATEGTVGDKIAKAVTPKSLAEIIPMTKAIKASKAIYKYLTG